MSPGVPTAFLFPGQGAQTVGMAARAYGYSAAARRVFDEMDHSLEIPLSKVVMGGPPEALVMSNNAQPALLCASIALLRAMEEQFGTDAPWPVFLAGHSLGEYSALVAAGSIELTTGLQLVRQRGELMQEACEASPSGLAAVLGLSLAEARRACQGTGAEVANANSAEQIVIGGSIENLARARAQAEAAGAKRVIPLQVAGAFHTQVMRSAQEGMDSILAEIEFLEPSVPVIANTTALPMTSGSHIRDELGNQICGCVYWQQSGEYMVNCGVGRFVEFGPGKVLTGLVRRIAPDVQAIAVTDLDDLAALGVT